jgi:hypothetical protein
MRSITIDIQCSPNTFGFDFANARLLGDHAQRLHDDINRDILSVSHVPKQSISTSDVKYIFTETKLS